MGEPVGILYCTDSLAAGGAERQTVELITRLDRRRFSPHVFCLHGGERGGEPHFVEALRRAAVPVGLGRLPWRAATIPRCLLRVLGMVRSHRPAVVHAISHHCNHLVRLGRWLMPRRLRVITAIRTDYGPRQLFYERIEHRFSDCVVTNNPQMLVKLRDQARIPERKLVHIPNGLNLERFAANSDPQLRARLAPDVRHLGVMMARITLQKSPYLLAEAVGLLQAQNRLPADAQFWLVGEPDGSDQLGRLNESIRRHRLDARFRQFQATAQPEAFYHAADFTVLASLWEGVPNAVLESFAAGRPAIVSAAANACGLVRHGVTGWVVPTGNTEELARALGHALSMPSTQRESMGVACREQAAQFRMDRMVQRYECLYRALIEGDADLRGCLTGP